MGEKGRLQSNPVQRKPQPAKAIEVNVVEAPSEVAMESPFTVRAVVAEGDGGRVTNSPVAPPS